MKAAAGLAFLVLAVAAIGLVAFFGQELIGIANLIPGAVSVDGCTAKTGNSVIPVMGYYECKAQPEMRKYLPSSPFMWLNCGDDEYTKRCNFYVKCPANEQWFFGFLTVSTRLSYDIKSGNNAGVHYVNNVERCSPGSDLVKISLERGQNAYVEYQQWVINIFEPGGGHWQTISEGGVRVEEVWTPYGLWLESRLGKSGWYNKQGCSVNAGMKLCTSGSKCTDGLWDGKSYIDFGEAVNFLEGWALSPEEFTVHDYNGQKVYCAGTSIYSLGTIQLSNGCYKFPETMIGHVDCCPGQIAGDATCGSDFKWHRQVDEPCFTDIQCKGQGAWFADYSDPSRRTIVKGSCVDGECKYTKKTTECSTNEACPTGSVCVIDQFTGEGTCRTQEGVPLLPEPVITGAEEGGAGGNWWDPLVRFFWMWIVGFIIALILLVILAFLLPIPFLKMMVFRNYKMLFAAAAILGVLIAFIFAAPVASMAASLKASLV